MTIPINSKIKQILGTEDIWNTEEAIVQNGIIILTRDTDVWKQGNGNKKFKDLPVLLKTSNINTIYDKKIYFDEFPDSSVDTLAIISSSNSKVARSIELGDLKLLKESIKDTSNFSSNISIYGPTKVKIGSSINFSLFGYAYRNILGSYKLSSIWVLPDHSFKYIKEDTKLSILVPNDPSLIGKTWTIKGKLVDELTKSSSEWGEFNFNIVSDNTSGYINNLSINKLYNETPTISNISWSSDNQYKGKNYSLNIEVNNPNKYNTIFYKVICNKDDVKINQLPNIPNIFIIQYPDTWVVSTEVSFTIYVYNIYGEKSQITINKTVNL